jgi:hypothetical protein
VFWPAQFLRQDVHRAFARSPSGSQRLAPLHSPQLDRVQLPAALRTAQPL